MARVAETELVRSLEEGGLTRKAAEELVTALGHSHRRERRSDSWMLAYAALLTALIVGGFGWMSARIDTLDAKTTAQIGTLDAKINTLDAKIDKTREEMVQRLATIETIINERLPSAPR